MSESARAATLADRLRAAGDEQKMEPTPQYVPPSEPIASEALRSLAAHTQKTVDLASVLAVAGTRVHGLALLLFVLPETLPLPLPSASTVLAIPLLLISLHLALFGDQSLLPARVLSTKIPLALLVAAGRYVVPILAWTERHSHARWPELMHERLIGVACLYLSVVLLLPIPLMNAPPAICMAIISVGLIRRDGALVALGGAGTLVMTGAFIWAAEWLASLL